MKDLVFVNSKKEAVCSHVTISEGMLVTQDAALKLIKKYTPELREFGKVRFQNVPLPSGQKQKQYMLNEHQATLLITLMRNNPETVKFKVALVKQFANMQSWIKERLTASMEYTSMCSHLKEIRKIQGKETKGFHYANEAKLVNWALTGEFQKIDRAFLSESQLNILADLERYHAVLLGLGHDRDTRKELLKNRFNELRD